MRRRRYRRPKHRVISPWPEDRPPPGEVAARATYIGSAEHKDYPSPAGHPALRSDASRCDPALGDFDELTQVLREAIERCCTGAVFEGDFPKYVWGWIGGQLYEARHINGPQGTYKGYPLEAIEYPKDDQGLLDWDGPDA